MSCCICSPPNSTPLQDCYDDRYGYPGLFKMFRCQSCGHAYLQCDFSNDQITELYTKYYPRSKFSIDQYKPHQEIKGFKSWLDGTKSSTFRWVPRDVRILDIGCGFGKSLGYHTNRGCDVYGIEADKNIQQVTDKFGFNVHIGLFRPELYESGFFDYVTMDQVIEHVTDPLATLKGVAKILKKNGTAIISTPNASGWGARIFRERWIHWHAPYHIQFFSKQSLKIAAEQAGLQVKQVKTITNSEWLSYQWIHLFTCPQQGTPSVFWDINKEQSVRVTLLIRLFSLLHNIKVNHFITRLFDSLGIGDNYLFILKKP